MNVKSQWIIILYNNVSLFKSQTSVCLFLFTSSLSLPAAFVFQSTCWQPVVTGNRFSEMECLEACISPVSGVTCWKVVPQQLVYHQKIFKALFSASSFLWVSEEDMLLWFQRLVVSVNAYHLHGVSCVFCCTTLFSNLLYNTFPLHTIMSFLIISKSYTLPFFTNC